jgi:phosphoribosylformylglycinamidine synthase
VTALAQLPVKPADAEERTDNLRVVGQFENFEPNSNGAAFSGLPPIDPASYNNQVKARVFVSLKKTVLDPQGQTVRSALTGLGYQSVSEVRQGKFFDIALSPGITRDQAHKEIDTLARDVLTNPVIEEYQVEISE